MRRPTSQRQAEKGNEFVPVACREGGAPGHANRLWNSRWNLKASQPTFSREVIEIQFGSNFNGV